MLSQRRSNYPLSLERAVGYRRVALVASAHLLDLFTFMLVVASIGIVGEGNPVAVWIYQYYGMAGAIGFKLLGTAALAALSYGSLFRFWIAFTFGVVGFTTNVLSLMVIKGML